ncbi:MAG: hypothetical protein WAL05_08245 [Candidatus Sulfotelmatobacter sp.]
MWDLDQVTAMPQARRIAPTATTDTIHTHAPLTATTGLTGSPADSSSAPARGMAGTVGGAGVAVGAVATTAEDGAAEDGAAEATMDMLATADVATRADSMELTVFMELADSMAEGAASTVVVDSMAEGAASMVAEAAASTVVVADTGDPGRVNCASSNGWQADAASRFALRRVTISC